MNIVLHHPPQKVLRFLFRPHGSLERTMDLWLSTLFVYIGENCSSIHNQAHAQPRHVAACFVINVHELLISMDYTQTREVVSEFCEI